MPEKITKIMRYQIKSPVDYTWKEINKILYEIQYQSYRLANKTIQLLWDFQNLSFTYKERFGEYLNIKDLPNKYNSIEGDISNQLRDDFYKLPSGTFDSVVIDSKSKWQTHKNEILKGEKSIINFKRDYPIKLRNRQIKIEHKEKDIYVFTLGLLSKEYKNELDRFNKTQISFNIKAYDNTQRVILDRIILSGEYTHGSAELINYKNKWFINLCYSFIPKEKELDKSTILGIDMGTVFPAYLAINNSHKREKIEGSEIDSFRRKTEKRRNEYLRQGKYCGKGRRGHGRNTRINPIEKLRDKVENFKNSVNHKYSKFIVDFAIKNNCGIIQMEDLSKIADGEKKRTFLGKWTYYDLQQKIEYKAKEKGIEVKKINPQYTSQRCSKCGYIDSNNRVSRDKFVCQSCGYDTHADYNAAKNISLPNIEEVIGEYIKST